MTRIALALLSLFAGSALAQHAKPEVKKDPAKKDAKPDDSPKATVTLEGRTVRRTRVENDTGTRLVWRVVRETVDPKTKMPVRDEQEVDARAELVYTHPDATAGKYTITLELFDTAKTGVNKDGYHRNGDKRTSMLKPVAPAVIYTVAP